MATLGDDLYGHFEELPCEFCEVLYPFDLLYEHQIICRHEIGEATNQQVESPNRKSPAFIEESVPKESPPQVEVLLKTQPKEPKAKTSKESPAKAPAFKPAPTVQKETQISLSEKIKKDFNSKNILSDITSPEPSTLTFEDSVMQERAPKIMAFGNQHRIRFEEEKPSFRLPSLFHLTEPENKDLNYLSDSEDATESLEDFWKRAEIKISQQLNRSITL